MRGGPIWLVGMMGAGKSAVGPLLAERLGRRFVDSDAEIERSSGRTIAEIFDEDGESAFRVVERELIASLCDGSDVVSLGGGAIAEPGAPELLGRRGTVVYLSAQVSTLIRRLGDCASRPLLRDLDSKGRVQCLTELLGVRQAAYRSAAVEVVTDGISLRHVVDEIIDRISESGDAIAHGMKDTSEETKEGASS